MSPLHDLYRLYRERDSLARECDELLGGCSGGSLEDVDPDADTVPIRFPRRIDAPPPRVLLHVEDEPGAVDLVRRWVEPYGWKVLQATSLREAQELLDGGRASRVLLDWLWSVGAPMRLVAFADQLEPPIPVAVYTGADEALVRRDCAGLALAAPLRVFPKHGTRPHEIRAWLEHPR